MAFELEAGEARVAIDPAHGARIASLRVAGLDLLVPSAPSPMHWGCYAMAPWAGRVRGGRFTFEGVGHDLPRNLPPHAIHGTVFDRPARPAGGGRFVTELGEPWPWSARVVQEMVLEPGRLALRIEVHAAERPFPASAGWHPWFRRRLEHGGDATLDFRPGAMYERDAEGIPSGRRVPPPPGPWDDCFTDLRADPVLDWPGALRLTLSSSCTHWVVYDEPAHALCVEPMTGPPDALNLAPAVVTPEAPLVATAELRWELPG